MVRIKAWLSEEKSDVLLGNINKLVQFVVIVVAALWTLSEFLAFTRTNQQLTIEQLRLSIRNAGISVALQEDVRFVISMDIKVDTITTYDDGSHLYDIFADASVQNVSGKSLDVAACYISMHLGTMNAENTPINTALIVNGPPSMRGEPEPGPVVWSQLAVAAYRFGGQLVPANAWLNLARPTIPPGRILNGACASRHSPGVTLHHSEHIRVRAMPTALFSTSIYLKVPDDANDGRPTVRQEWVTLKSADAYEASTDAKIKKGAK